MMEEGGRSKGETSVASIMEEGMEEREERERREGGIQG